jgi:hypothetical protein
MKPRVFFPNRMLRMLPRIMQMMIRRIYASGIIGLASVLLPVHAQDIPGQVTIVQA